LLIALISRNILIILKNNYQNKRGNKFYKQIIALFSLVTIAPAACVFIFAVIFFNTGVESLFKTPVKNIIDNASQISSIYVDEKKIAMVNFTSGVGERIKDCIDGFFLKRDKMETILYEETEKLKIDAMVIQSTETKKPEILAQTPFSIALEFENLPENITYFGNGGIASWESNDSVVTSQLIDRSLGIYLIASSKIDQNILDHKHNIKNAILEYTNLATQRAGLKMTFMTFFFFVTILLLAVSILAGLLFANGIVRPVNKLIIATRNVSVGDYNTPIKAKKFNNEWDVLISTFNRMIEQLEYQKQQLIISNKQNTWKDIARKIAHEIKNPLTPIQLSAERLRRKYKNEISSNPEIFNSCIDTIIRQVQCIGTLVKEFSDFARMPAPKIEPIDIIKLLKETVFIQASAHKNIIFQQNYSDENFICNVDQSQMNQVMMNILQNAINAIIENNQNNDDEFIGKIRVNFSVNQRSFCIIVEDDGPGFSEVAIEKALEPYYTTREAGNGLGLAIVYKIITEHGGTIKLGKSDVLLGASVIIEIPC
jgi:nitrogen fixation/metabolism regulation signal transduction histidine kinase